MNRKFAACDYTRSAPSYFALPLEISGFSESLIRCCVRIPLRAFSPSHLAATEDESAVSEDLPSFATLTHRLRRTRRGPGWDSTVPWFDRQFQVELQGFGRSLLKRSGDRFSVFSPVADDVGLIRRCQRSTCVAAVLPAPMRGKENHAIADSTQWGSKWTNFTPRRSRSACSAKKPLKYASSEGYSAAISRLICHISSRVESYRFSIVIRGLLPVAFVTI